MNEQLSATRTIGQVTQEINYLKAQGQKTILGFTVEIGRRLTEAKGMLPHGEWGRWLREEVGYSKSSANNAMRIFEEYGSTQMGLFGPEVECQTFGNLDYTKALALIAVPAEEREQFAKDADAENISVRELKAQIKAREQERDEAENRAKGWEQKYAQATEREKNRAADLTDALTQAEKAQAAEKAAREDLEAKDTALKLANQRLAAHSAEVERLQKELEAERAKPAEVAVQTVDATPEQLAKAEKKGKREGKKAAETALNEKIAQAEEQAKAAEKATQEARNELEEAQKRLAQQAQVKALAEVNVVFRQLQETLNQVRQGLNRLDDLNRQKVKSALVQVLAQQLEELK